MNTSSLRAPTRRVSVPFAAAPLLATAHTVTRPPRPPRTQMIGASSYFHEHRQGARTRGKSSQAPAR